ncbi:Cfr10I/Bse634I family restriction endonuclease [Paenibacillus elgii]|uniref:Cfr10I/Bse634I family restriction endonuclease n=1 Tax=Paenibacillus elgii TaxID=189691 RepID=UPI00203F7213|nr:Cfr10I/Bse634I family restriction endonuclease [Paenibacillus elgii]MCM3269096.1 Cfr10I/Bse634I family restriction endonuclease [Paenibacillus elgii]
MMEFDFSTSNSVEQYATGKNQKTRIKPYLTLAEVFGEELPTGTIKENLDKLEQHAKNAAFAQGFAVPNSQAFSNTRGFWFEVFIAVQAWNYRIRKNITDVLIVKMPNVITFDFRRIFEDQTKEMLNHLEVSLLKNQVRLITSNPDLLIVKQENLIQEEHNIPISRLDTQSIMNAVNLYKALENKCHWDSLKAGIGVKTSLRPDRRLQVVHEGNILKSLFAHLKMRHWNREAIFEYYGASSEMISGADDDALQTAATHTIVNVDSLPERAVDGLFSLLTFADIDRMLDEIIKRKASRY